MDALHQRLNGARRRLVLRAVVRACVEVSVAMAALALIAALALPSLPRWIFAAALVLGPLLGLARALRARPTDGELVLWIDRRLDAREAIVAAWELGDDAPPLMRGTAQRASDLLASAALGATRPRTHAAQLVWLAPAALFGAAAAFVPVPSGSANGQVVIASADALRRVERLPEEERDPERRRRLDEAARRARELARELRRGMERERASEALESIRRELAAARRVESTEERRAREAALDALSAEPEMRRALAERDPAALDRAVERAAARREAADRRRARRSLTDAAEAARGAGGEELARSLLRRERLLRRRAEQARLARELAEAMPELASVRRQLERLERDGEGAELSQALVDAMREAWSRLTPEERARLAGAMRHAEAAAHAEANAQRSDATRPLDVDELEQRLRQALEDLDRLAIGVGGGGIPIAAGSAGQGRGEDGRGDTGQGGGPGRGGGPGARGGETAELAAEDGPLARVRPPLGQGAPSQTTFEWADPEGAPLPSGLPTGEAIGGVAAGQPGAIERAPIPEDYREHVRTYFGGGERE